MGQSKILELARQGDPQAIATLMNRSLTPKGISATIQRENYCLKVELTAAETPDAQILVPFVRNRISSLAVQHIQKVQIYGSQTAAVAPAWMEEFDLQPPKSPASLQPRPLEPPVTRISATSLLHAGSSPSPTNIQRLRLVFIGGTVISLVGLVLVYVLLVETGFLNLQNPLLLLFSFIFLNGNLGPLGFLLSFVLALIPAVIALDKGRDFSLWWFYGLHLLIPAIAHALVLPPLVSTATPLPSESTLSVCPYCAEILRGPVTLCPSCGRSLPLQESSIPG